MAERDEHDSLFDDTDEGSEAAENDERGSRASGGGEEASLPQQYVRFTFYKVDPSWRRLAPAERAEHKAELAGVIERASNDALIQPYSLVGTRGDTDFMLWHASPDLDDMFSLAAAIHRTAMASYLTIPYSYLSVTKRSIYTRGHRHPDQPESRLEVRMGEGAYLVVYPFVKIRPWYKLTHGARQGMMVEHIRIGHKYPNIRIHTTYSVGLDDQEFVLAFDADRPLEFVDLMMELRFSEASAYTLRDTPSFTCKRTTIREALDLLD
jgi:chlorite dismutase